MKYHLFGWQNYYPDGGYHDHIRSSCEIASLKETAERALEEGYLDCLVITDENLEPLYKAVIKRMGHDYSKSIATWMAL